MSANDLIYYLGKLPWGLLGKPEEVILHWTAGSLGRKDFYRNAVYQKYHFNVLGDATVVQTLSVKDKGEHVAGRNSGKIGVTMCCMGSDANGHPIQPTKMQVERTARLVAELCQELKIPLSKVFDHAHYAALDGYSNLRWDVGSYYKVIIGKSKWYYAKLLLPKLFGGIENSIKGKLR